MAASCGISRVISVAGLCHNFTRHVSLCSRPHLHGQCCRTLTNRPSNVLPISQVEILPRRHASWFNTLTADRLWKSMTALTGKAHTKARGKKPQKRIKMDLNRGRNIGEGKAGLVWSGLNSRGAVQFQDDQVAKPQVIDPERETYLANIRSQQGRRRKNKLSQEDRGWTSAGWGGRSLGPPDPIPGENFEGFNSKVMFVKRVFNMTANVGRKRSMVAMVVVGNGKGALGCALGKGSDAISALRKAKNKAATKIQYVERYDNHTVLHDIEYKFIATRVRMRRAVRGTGLKSHRAIQDICHLAGITDIYAKVYGSTNLLNLVQATVKGLVAQETYEQIAKRKGLHVVQFRMECGPLPIILASPDKDHVREDDVDEEEWDKVLPLERKEVTKKTKKNPFARPGKLVVNEHSASSNPTPEVYNSQTSYV